MTFYECNIINHAHIIYIYFNQSCKLQWLYNIVHCHHCSNVTVLLMNVELE